MIVVCCSLCVVRVFVGVFGVLCLLIGDLRCVLLACCCLFWFVRCVCYVCSVCRVRCVLCVVCLCFGVGWCAVSVGRCLLSMFFFVGCFCLVFDRR